MAAETKSDLVKELGTQSTKADLVELLGSRLKKDEISKLLDDDSDGTKEELLRKLSSRTKDELVQAVESRLTKDEIEKAVAARDDSGDDEVDEDRGADQQRGQQRTEAHDEQGDEQRGARQDDRRSRQQDEQAQRRTRHADDAELDWNTELEWSPAPQPTPAPVAYSGAAPFMPGSRVRVDLAGLPTLGIFLGKGASAAGTIVGVNAHERSVRVYLDACFDGEKEIVLPPERVFLDG
jgi:hypothetical protein